MINDYHIHTRLCGHAVGEIEQYVEHALAIGLPEIGFSDHMPMEVWGRHDPELTMALREMDTYLAWVHDMQRRYGNRIRIKLGIEADYVPGKEREVERFLQRYDFDYVIGSVHFLGEWGFDDSRDLAHWGEQPVDESYRQYFETLIASIQSGLFDIIGHPDLIKKFGHRPQQSCDAWYRQTAAAAADAGVAVEINTSGLHKPVKEMYPHPDFVAALHAAGVPLMINSDAHAPEQVGRDWPRGAALAWQAGVRRVPLYAQRRIERWVDLQGDET